MSAIEPKEQFAVTGEKPVSAVETVLSYIRDGMREGRFAPGQRLVEPDLIATLQVSRGTVREALTRLQGEGLVEFERHRGARIRILSRKKVMELNQIRGVVEGLAARLAAVNINDASREKLLAAQVSFERAMEDYAGYNEKLHNAIIELSQNGSLHNFVSATMLETFRLQFSRALSTREMMQRSYSEHADIVEAILKKDPVLAEQRMIAHIEASCEGILRSPDHYFSR